MSLLRQALTALGCWQDAAACGAVFRLHSGTPGTERLPAQAFSSLLARTRCISQAACAHHQQLAE